MQILVDRFNQYTAASGVTLGHDANGNLISDGTRTYTYDVENRLVKATGGTTVDLRYDPLGRLYEVKSGTTTTRFLWDGDELVMRAEGVGSSNNMTAARRSCGVTCMARASMTRW